MTDMSDKLSFINRDSNGHIKCVGNLVGCSFKEADERAKELEKTQDDHFELIKDEKIFQIIQYFNDKEDRKFMADKDDWNELVKQLEYIEDYMYDAKKAIQNYINTLKEKEE